MVEQSQTQERLTLVEDRLQILSTTILEVSTTQEEHHNHRPSITMALNRMVLLRIILKAMRKITLRTTLKMVPQKKTQRKQKQNGRELVRRHGAKKRSDERWKPTGRKEKPKRPREGGNRSAKPWRGN
jgi:hypothetical protein